MKKANAIRVPARAHVVSGRTRLSYLMAFLVFTLMSARAAAVVGPREAAPPQPSRLVVKLRPAVEAQMAASRQSLATAAPALSAVLQRHDVMSLRPLLPERAQRKAQTGETEARIAAASRRRFSARAARVSPGTTVPDLGGLYVVDLGGRSEREVRQILGELRADPGVMYAELDHTRSVFFVPNDPYFSSRGSWGQEYDDLHGLKRIGAPAAWDLSRGQGVVVAVIDTGIDHTHPDIAANLWTNTGETANNGRDDDGNGFVDDVRGWDFVGPDSTRPTPDDDPEDQYGHGTHVAGTIAATGHNGIGVIGVAWNARVMAVKGLDDSGNGSDTTLAAAIIYAADEGADIINASWGGPGTSQVLNDAVAYAHGLGVLFVAAAGNSSADVAGFSPANLPQAIAVASLTPRGELSNFSNFGGKIEIAAPGEDILSLEASSDDYAPADGTSMAAPHVSGVAALILARQRSFTNEQIRQALRASVTDLGGAGKDDSFGYGRVDAARAVQVERVLTPRITAPRNGAAAATLPVTVTGSAQGTGFRNYVLDFGAGPSPTAWTVLRDSTTPVTNGTLGTFDRAGLAQGLYSIRLRAFDTAGKAFVDQVQVTVRFAALTSPAPATVRSLARAIKPGLALPITGTAGGRGFQRFRLEWAPGANPTGGWSTAGITLAGGGTQPVLDGPLGTWASPAGLARGDYTLRLVVTDSAATHEARAALYVEPDLVSPAWPRLVSSANAGHAPVPVRQPDGSTRFLLCELLDMAPGSSCSLYSADGGVVRVDFPQQGPAYQPAVGNLDGQPGDEIVVPDEFQIKVYSSSFGLVRTISNQTTTRRFGNYPLSLVDLDGDGTLEIVTLSYGMIGFEEPQTDNTDFLYVYRADGRLFSTRYPVLIPQEGYGFAVFTTVDLNGDGRREIVVAGMNPDLNTQSLMAFSANGAPFAGWPKRSFNSRITDLRSADIDNDGVSDLILQEWVAGSDAPTLRVLNAAGAVRAGWPVRTASDTSRLAVGDLDRDGRNEIVVANEGGLHVLRDDGRPFSASWPVAGLFGGAVIADVDNDGFPEIVAGSSTGNTYDARLTAYRRDATVLRQWRLFGLANNPPGAGVPTAGEFTGDGKTDVVVNVPLYSPTDDGSFTRSALTWLATGMTYNAAASDWPVNTHDAQGSNALPSPAAGTCRLANDGGPWQNTAFDAAQSGTFTMTFEATPSAAGVNSVVGLSQGAQGAYSGFAALVRFNSAGRIDARNGGAYTASTIRYAANTRYRFRLVVDVVARRYAAYVTAPGGTEKTIGTALAFRTEQNAVTRLDSWGTFAETGALAVCHARIQ